MTPSELTGFIIFVLISLSLIGLSIPLLMGKGTGLIAGYNTMTPQEKAQWDGPALARFTGRLLLVIGLTTLLFGAGLFLLALEWLTWVYLAVVLGLSVFAVIYCNTGSRFKK